MNTNPTLYVTEAPNDDDLFGTLGLMAIHCPIPHGDVNFFGVSDNDEPLRICVERKKVPDMASCVLSNRYLNQIQSAKDAGFDVLAIIVEGRYKCSSDDGLLLIPGFDKERGKSGWKPCVPAISFSRFDQYLTEIDYLVGVIVKHSEDVRGTADVVKALWLNFQTASKDHNSLKAIYRQPSPHALLSKPSLVRRIATEFPNVGWERSKAVADRFPTVRDMCNAGVEEWREIDGIGKEIAKRVIQAINGGKGINNG